MAVSFFWIGYHFEKFRSQVAIRKKKLISRPVNPLHPNISLHILHTVLYTFPKVLTRRFCLTTKNFFGLWSFPLFSWKRRQSLLALFGLENYFVCWSDECIHANIKLRNMWTLLPMMFLVFLVLHWGSLVFLFAGAYSRAVLSPRDVCELE